jgi:hypothetical protein
VGIQKSASVGCVLGVLGGLGCFTALSLAMLPRNDSGSADPNEAECGTGLFGLIMFAPVIVPMLMTLGGAAGALIGLLVGFLGNTTERASVSAIHGTIVLPRCSKCDREATPGERNLSPLCPGCGEPLPRAIGKTVIPEL